MRRHNLLITILFPFCMLALIFFYLMVNAPNNEEVQKIAIKKGESLEKISQELEESGLIPSAFLFQFYCKMINCASKIKAGYYLVPPKSSIKSIIFLITSNHFSQDTIFLIKEGETLKEIERHLQEEGILDLNESISDLRVKDFLSEYPKLFSGVEEDNSLEGFLFPDSYHFPPGLTAQEIMREFLDNFLQHMMKKNLFSVKSPHTFYKNLIMASLLEKEVKTIQDKRMVADILWRRLKAGIPLQVDATICYSQKKSFVDCQLNKQSFQIDSPYNTYLYRGLPPTPICNPGLDSLEAAFNPLPNDYWYYLSDRKTGKTIFSQNYREHLRMKQKYL